MTHARAFGVPVPEVFGVSGSDIMMERVAGPTMLEVLARRPWTVRDQARLLARLHAQVHQVPVIPELPAPCDDDAGRDREVLLHMDLHPQNVILTATGPVIIDWEAAARGPAGYNVAMTWVIMHSSQVEGRHLRVSLTRALQVAFTRSFARAAGPIDQAWLAIAVRHRLTDPNVRPAERTRLERLPHG